MLDNLPLLLFLHGNFFDEALVFGALAYLLIMFGLSRLKYQRLKKEKLRRKAERMARAQVNNPPANTSTTDKPEPL